MGAVFTQLELYKVLIETPRLLLRNFQANAVIQLAPILVHPQVMKFSPTGILSIAATQAKKG